MTLMTGLPNRHHETGLRIRRLRLSTGHSQERFAPKIGITRRHLIRLENGEHLPSKTLAARIEQVVEELTGKSARDRVLGSDDEEDGQLPPLSRVELSMLGDLMARLGATIALTPAAADEDQEHALL